MLPFRLSKDAKHWFKLLFDQGGFKIGFDAFYFCFISGVVAKRKQSVTGDETEELVRYFPEPYSSRGRLLVGLFLKSELETLGVAMEEREGVYSVINKLMSPDSPNFLSATGVREFNNYAHGGYEQLNEWFDDRPRSLETFLPKFKAKIDETL